MSATFTYASRVQELALKSALELWRKGFRNWLLMPRSADGLQKHRGFGPIVLAGRRAA